MLLCLQRLLLVLALLFSQQVALGHAQDHLLKGTASDQKVCEQCALAAQLGASPTSNPPHFPAVTPDVPVEGAILSVFHPGVSAPFSSRAPPTLD